VAFEDEVAAVLNLGDGVEAGEAHPGALLWGELRTENERPLVELLANDGRAEAVGGGLQGGQVIDSQEGVVVLLKTDTGALSSRSMKECPLSQ
jgi:hypothetical protein